MRAVLFFVALLACPALLRASVQQEAADTESNANPIRKVVTMLQKMQTTISAEGEKEEELFDKFMCYCKNGAGALSASINAANSKIPEVSSDIESGEGQKKQLEEDLKTHRADLDAAKSTLASGEAIRQKEAAAFASESAEYKANIAAIAKATTAIENGMGSAFLQASTGVVQILKDLAQKQDLDEGDREQMLGFLSQDSEYSPASDQIVGILKTMNDEMSTSLANAEVAEKTAVANYNGMTAAKTKEVGALKAAIEDKTARVGELAVNIVEMKTELTDTQEALVEDRALP
jgi:outer membrane murein-binding lipoprotein Lpp